MEYGVAARAMTTAAYFGAEHACRVAGARKPTDALLVNCYDIRCRVAQRCAARSRDGPTASISAIGMRR